MFTSNYQCFPEEPSTFVSQPAFWWFSLTLRLGNNANPPQKTSLDFIGSHSPQKTFNASSMRKSSLIWRFMQNDLAILVRILFCFENGSGCKRNLERKIFWVFNKKKKSNEWGRKSNSKRNEMYLSAKSINESFLSLSNSLSFYAMVIKLYNFSSLTIGETLKNRKKRKKQKTSKTFLN